MAMLSVTLKDPVYRRRWQDLVYMGHRVLLDALLKTTDPTFYIKDVMDMMHTVEGQHTWRRVGVNFVHVGIVVDHGYS